MSALDDFLSGFRDRYGEGRSDYTQNYYAARELKGEDPEGPRINSTLATNPTIYTAQDLMNISDPTQRRMREDRGMGLSKNGVTRAGQVLGTLANDITQDHTRSLWWLLNAAQATGNIINESALAAANPDLYKRPEVLNKAGNTIQMPAMEDGQPVQYRDQERTFTNQQRYMDAMDAGLINKEGVLQKGVNINKSGNLQRRKFNPGDVAALGIAPGIAINAGLGLMTPFGGYEGYEAVIPSEEDPSKTANVIAEIGAKYILGRTGNLLDYDEFKEVRPDVSKGEYNAYKAFKYDKNIDLNPFDDGQINLPAGVLKATKDGIHGAEVQFLGRSLPVNTALIPFATSVIGGAMGVRGKRPIQGGLIGGGAGLVTGTVVGNLLEAERRRRNTVSREIDPEQSLVEPG